MSDSVLPHLLHYSLYIDSFLFLLGPCKTFLASSQSLSPGYFICDSILFSRFLIIFTIMIRNSLSGRFPISSSFVWFGGHLSCSFTCWVVLCLFILFILLRLGILSLFWQFVEFSLLWSFLSVSGVVRVACQGFLVREAYVGVLVGGAVFLLSGVQ